MGSGPEAATGVAAAVTLVMAIVRTAMRADLLNNIVNWFLVVDVTRLEADETNAIKGLIYVLSSDSWNKT